ncbi:MAG: pseudouridine synthase [Lachnospiraceae bacterium]
MAKMRADKFLSQLKICTRSEAKKIIRAKRLTCDGSYVCQPEDKIDPEQQSICLDQQLLSYEPYLYYMFYKPKGCVSATKDRQYKTVCDYIPTTHELFPVGRLDLDTEGLLILTDDGAFAHELLSPTKHIPKTYYAEVSGTLGEEDIQAMAKGLSYGEAKPSKPAQLDILVSGTVSKATLTITEGKFHQVKRMFAALGKKVLYLKRIQMGELKLDSGLSPGEYRSITKEEKALLTCRQQ